MIKNKSVHCCEMFAIHHVCYWELSRYQSFILKCKPQILSVKPNSKYFATIIPFLHLPCSIQSTILFHAVGAWHKNYDTENSTDLLCIMLLNKGKEIFKRFTRCNCCFKKFYEDEKNGFYLKWHSQQV